MSPRSSAVHNGKVVPHMQMPENIYLVIFKTSIFFPEPENRKWFGTSFILPEKCKPMDEGCLVWSQLLEMKDAIS